MSPLKSLGSGSPPPSPRRCAVLGAERALPPGRLHKFLLPQPRERARGRRERGREGRQEEEEEEAAVPEPPMPR